MRPGHRRAAAPRRLRPRLRSIAFVLVGVALAVTAQRYGRWDALFGAVAGIVPVLVTWIGLLTLRRRPRYSRRLASTLACAGETVEVRLVPASKPRPHPGDTVIDPTPAGPRFALPRLDPAGTLAYRLPLPQRGVWSIGPAVIRHADVFGLAGVDDAVAPPAQIAVAPRSATVALPRLTSEERETPSRVLTAQRILDPAMVRDYRAGDPRRLVHWRATLRRGHLMVRGERPRGHADVWVVLDTVLDDRSGVRGGVRRRTEQAAWGAVEDGLAAATAVAVAAMRAGHRVHLVETGYGHLEDAFGDLTNAGSVGTDPPLGPLERAGRPRGTGRSRGEGRPRDAERHQGGQGGRGERGPGRRYRLGGASSSLGPTVQKTSATVEPQVPTESLLRAMASLRLGGRYNPQWHRPILAATEESGVPAPVVVVLAHVTPGRLVAAGDVARLADPALAWAPDPPARSALASAGFVPITVHLDSAEPVR